MQSFQTPLPRLHRLAMFFVAGEIIRTELAECSSIDLNWITGCVSEAKTYLRHYDHLYRQQTFFSFQNGSVIPKSARVPLVMQKRLWDSWAASTTGHGLYKIIQLFRQLVCKGIIFFMDRVGRNYPFKFFVVNPIRLESASTGVRCLRFQSSRQISHPMHSRNPF